MEFSIKSVTLFSALFLTGLSAGLFFAWSVSVIPGTKRVPDLVYLQTMQAFNRAILNPGFFLIFFGSLFLLVLSSILYFQDRPTFWLLLAAALSYLLGTFGVTALGNVPLNDSLDALDLGELAIDLLARTRQEYEGRWNRFHRIRTVFAVLSFLFSLAGVFIYLKSA